MARVSKIGQRRPYGLILCLLGTAILLFHQLEAIGASCSCGDGKIRLTISGQGVIEAGAIVNFSISPDQGDVETAASEPGNWLTVVGLNPDELEFYLDYGDEISITVTGASSATDGSIPSGQTPPPGVDITTGLHFGLSFSICGDAYVVDSFGDRVQGMDASTDQTNTTFKIAAPNGALPAPGDSEQGLGNGPSVKANQQTGDPEYQGDLSIGLSISLGHASDGSPIGELVYRDSMNELASNEPVLGDVELVTPSSRSTAAFPVSGEGIKVYGAVISGVGIRLDVKNTSGTTVLRSYEVKTANGSFSSNSLSGANGYGRRILITDSAAPDTAYYALTPAGGTDWAYLVEKGWSTTGRDGADEWQSAISNANDTRTVERYTQEGTGPVSKTQEVYKMIGVTNAEKEELMISSSVYPDGVGGSSLDTTYTYYETKSSGEQKYKKVKSINDPSGSWTLYDYVHENGFLVTKTWRPFKNGSQPDPIPTGNGTTGQRLTKEFAYYNEHAFGMAEYKTEEYIEGKLVGKVETRRFLSQVQTVATALKPSETIATDAIVEVEYRSPTIAIVTRRHYLRQDGGWPDWMASSLVQIDGPDRLSSTQIATGNWDSLLTERRKIVYCNTAVQGSAPGWNYSGTSGDGFLIESHQFPQIAGKSTYEITLQDPLRRVLRTRSFVNGLGSVPLSATSYDYSENVSDGSTTTETWEGDYGAVTSTVVAKSNEIVATDVLGVSTTTTTDAAGRVKSEIRSSFQASEPLTASVASVPAQETYYSYSYPTNRVREEIRVGAPGSGGNPPSPYVLSWTEYDLIGRVTGTRDENGYITSYSYNDATRTTTVTRPDGENVLTTNFIDGSVQSITGNGVVNLYYDYKVTTSGYRRTRVSKNNTVSWSTSSSNRRWSETWLDWLGQPAQIRRPHPSTGAIIIEYYYYDKLSAGGVSYGFPGKLARKYTGTLGREYFEYDSLGNLIRQGQDLDSSYGLQTGASTTTPDQIVDYTRSYFADAGTLWEKQETKRGAVTSTLLSNSHPSSSGVFQRTVAADPSGWELYTERRLETDVWATVSTDNRSDIVRTRGEKGGFMLYETEVIGATPSIISGVITGTPSTSAYDAFGRSVGQRIYTAGVENPSEVTNAYRESGAERYLELISRSTELGVGPAIVDTWLYFSSSDPNGAGQVSHQTVAGKTSEYDYDEYGRLLTIDGAGEYPIRFVYDGFGNLSKMYTYQDNVDFSNNGVGSVTEWIYSPNGTLLSKIDPIGKTVSFSYDTNGLLSSRTWARNGGITATYTYTKGAQVATVSYSDSSVPTTNFEYNERGQLLKVTGGDQACTLSYDGVTGELIGEDWGSGTLDDYVLARTFDLGRPTSIVVDSLSTQVANQSLTYGLSAAGNDLGLASVVDGLSQRALYDFDKGMVQKLNYQQTSAIVLPYFRSTRAYRPNAQGKGQLASISVNAIQNGLIRTIHSTENASLRPVRIDTEDGSYYRFEYNSRGELEKQDRAVYDGTTTKTLFGSNYQLSFDNIGNRTYRKVVGFADVWGKTEYDSSGSGVTDAANQYKTIKNDSLGLLSGTADPSDALTFDGGNGVFSNEPINNFVLQHWYFSIAGGTPNSIHLDYDVKVNGTSQESGFLFYPETNENRTHDDDGNLTRDARWEYSWDAENRLRWMYAADRYYSATATPIHRLLQFTYDWRGRRIEKKVSIGNVSSPDPETPAHWDLERTEHYVYDGWKLVHQWVDDASGSTGDYGQSYVWGLDLEQTLDGTGGVGGLLFVEELNNSKSLTSTHGVVSDLSGNVIALIKGSGSVFNQTTEFSARYDYAAFGELARRSGEMADKNPFQFSTKFTDVESGLSYYGFRYYDPVHGRWLSRDPIGERGGLNLYGFVGNDPVNRWDYLGLTDDYRNAYVLVYEAWDPIFTAFKNSVKRKIESKVPEITLFRNYPGETYDESCGDKIFEVPVRDGSAWEKVKQYKRVSYVASFGHGTPGQIWYNRSTKPFTELGQNPDNSIVYAKGGRSRSSIAGSEYHGLSKLQGVQFNDSGYAELYHCSAGSGVTNELERIWGVNVFGAGGGLNRCPAGASLAVFFDIFDRGDPVLEEPGNSSNDFGSRFPGEFTPQIPNPFQDVPFGASP